jgi:hypothetical protein
VVAPVILPTDSQKSRACVVGTLVDGRSRTTYDADGVAACASRLCCPDLKLVVEYDGRQHREDLDHWDHDVMRRDWRDAEGWAVVGQSACAVTSMSGSL